MNIEIMKLALEALETSNKAWKALADSGDAGWWEAEEQPFYEISVKAITALRQAIEQAEQTQPLTDEEIRDFYGDNNNFDITGPYVIAFARAIEAAHGIGKREKHE